MAVCDAIDALARFQFDVISKLNKKFIGLRRLAQLLEQLGDLSELVPNITGLIPVVDINLSLYNELAAACPFLNLPAPGEASLRELQQHITGAYANLMKGVLNHPFNRLSKLQGQLSKYQSQLNAPLAVAQDYIQCLQAACEAVEGGARLFANVAAGQVQSEIVQFQEFYTEQAGQVLTEGAQIKAGEATDTINTLNGLGAEVPQDFASSKSALQAVVAGAPETVDQSSGVEYKLPPYAPPPGS